jgi:ABC-2 type transport system ATP-binding protein
VNGSAIVFEGVSKAYGHRFSKTRVAALSNVSFEVATGEICAFLGPNGAGKTTSINLLMGFHSPQAGTIKVLGRDPYDVRVRQNIGFLSENPRFYPYLAAPELLRQQSALAGLGQMPRDLVEHLLSTVQLREHQRLRLSAYSRGMLQRLGLAQALIGHPQLLVLDEPTAGLDPVGRREVLDLLVGLRANGMTVFLSSHVLPEVEQISDRIVVLDRGRLVHAGSLRESLERLDRVEVVTNRLPAEITEALKAGGARVESAGDSSRVVTKAVDSGALLAKLHEAGCGVLTVTAAKGTLEEFFLSQVQRKEHDS